MFTGHNILDNSFFHFLPFHRSKLLLDFLILCIVLGYIGQTQIEGPAVWLQSQSARDLRNSSYYNGPTQNQQQQTRYSHQAQSIQTHIHPGAPGAMYGGNVYHHQQSGSSPCAHQLLQQQGLVGALGTRIGSYRQGQRWANGI